MYICVCMYQFRNKTYDIVQAKMLTKVNRNSGERDNLCKNIRQEQIIKKKIVDRKIKIICKL